MVGQRTRVERFSSDPCPLRRTNSPPAQRSFVRCKLRPGRGTVASWPRCSNTSPRTPSTRPRARSTPSETRPRPRHRRSPWRMTRCTLCSDRDRRYSDRLPRAHLSNTCHRSRTSSGTRPIRRRSRAQRDSDSLPNPHDTARAAPLPIRSATSTRHSSAPIPGTDRSPVLPHHKLPAQALHPLPASARHCRLRTKGTRAQAQANHPSTAILPQALVQMSLGSAQPSKRRD